MRPCRLLSLVFLAAVGLTARTLAQTSTGTVRGYVTEVGTGPLASAELIAKDVETGVERRTTTRADGGYTLPGLSPGAYDLTCRSVGYRPQIRRVQVRIGATQLVDFAMEGGAVEVEAVTVTAAAGVEMRTSEVATNVTPEQINTLPSSVRNFLDFAALAPGVQVQNDNIDGTRRTITYGAQNAEQINVFVDGASYKNDILRGGVAGQDASRGNPFPLSAIQEYRVLTQNYRAEYQRASSAVITAATRSGTNRWTGSAFSSYQSRSLVSLNNLQRITAARDSTYEKPEYTRYLYGVSAGGPLVRDRLFLFASWEGNRQNRSNLVSITPPTGYPALDTIDFASRNGEFQSPFRQNLLFGKLSFNHTQRSSFELSTSVRSEHDIRDFGGNTAFEAATRFQNAVTTGTLRHQYLGGAWLNELTTSYQRYHYNPVPLNPGPANLFFGFGCCAQLGSNISIQDFTQGRLGVRNDLSYTGLAAHTIKLGANVDFLSYDIIKRNSEIPRFVWELWYDSAGTPQRAEWQSGNPNFSSNNTQVGLYLQDDWSPSRRLTVNAGVRWDFESGMINTDYVTPQNVRDTLIKYQDSLFLPLDQNRYFTDGTQRKPYLGAIQPRLGLSFALDQAGRTVLFAGWGIFQDRTLYDQAIEERFAQQHPAYRILFDTIGGTNPALEPWDPTYLTRGKPALDSIVAGGASNTQEIKLLPNDLRPPMSQQFSIGVRRMAGPWAVELSYTGVRSRNVFTFYWANTNFTCPERSRAVPGCEVTRTIPGFGTTLFADNGGKTWYDAINLKLERSLTPGAGEVSWGAGVAYTYAQRQTQGFNDDFSFPNPVDYPRQVRNDERHHLTANWVVQSRGLGGLQFGGLLTAGSGQRYDVGDRFGGVGNPLAPGGYNAPAYSIVDLRVRKEFGFQRGLLGLSVDVFNVFNQARVCGVNGLWSRTASSDFGVPNCLSDPQRLQVGLDVTF
jgi:carboxypeptidase family protein/TonB-dependent receptor-like protein